MNLTRANRISGWMFPKELAFLANVASKCNTIIEVGSYYGRSCMAMADNTPGIVHSIDPYRGIYNLVNGMDLDFNDEVYNTFLYNLDEHLKSGKVVQHRVTFDKAPFIMADFIFIDGDHTYEGCLLDIKEAIKRINRGGAIAGHDYNQPGFKGVNQAVQEMFGDKKIEVIDSIWWVKND